MIRTVWLAIACLIGLAALTLIKVGTASIVQETKFPAEVLATNPLSDPPATDTLAKADRLDAADNDDAVKAVRPIAITPKGAEPPPSQASETERSWRSSYAKRQATGSRHRKGRLHRTSRYHRLYHASKYHGASKHMAVRRKSRRS
ncbi:hypothetical protein [uncultured Bradyrhizobium sp.]|uniref:hypothetical protein n=1 Tax=uncultured Bradyrhizobium sp. TaxID=199684 RepID=UPI0035CB6A1E